MSPALLCRSGGRPSSAWVLAVVLLLAPPSHPQQAQAANGTQDWEQPVRAKVRARQFDGARLLVEQRLLQDSSDLEARGWRGRLLAWQGRWREAESEYRFVVDRAPSDTEILCALASVLLWQAKNEDALRTVDRARALEPRQSDILLLRARILRALARTPEARQQYQAILALDPGNREAKAGLASLADGGDHEFRVGADASTFNYTDPAQAQGLLLISRWTPRWSTAVGAEMYQRFGEDAAKFTAGGSLHFTKRDWLTLTGAIGHTNGAIPRREASFEYGHGLRFSFSWIKGIEATYQQHWLWYEQAHVLALSLTQLYYLPRDCTWSLTISGARSGFSGMGIEWAPSGSTRLEFPMHRQLRASVTFANGAENFAHLDQIGRFSARTFGGGLKYRFKPRQDLAGYVAVQNRSQARTQNSYGLSYGIRF